MTAKEQQAKIIKELLKLKNISQDKLAKEMGVSRVTVISLINGSEAQQERVFKHICAEIDKFSVEIAKVLTHSAWKLIIKDWILDPEPMIIKIISLAMEYNIKIPENINRMHDYERIRFMMTTYKNIKN